MNERLNKVVKYSAILLLTGIVYLIWCRITGLCIPCLFRLNTGLYCPGCGITSMFIALSKLNFTEAFKCNPVVLVLIPIWLVLLFDIARSYIFYGEFKLNKLHNIVLWLSVACLGVFFLIRNIENYQKLFDKINNFLNIWFVLLKFFCHLLFIGVFKIL